MTQVPNRARTILSLLLTAAMLATLTVFAPPSSAAASAPSVSQSQVDESVDFATTEFVDAWDFSSNSDVPNFANLNHFKMTNVSRSQGVWKGTGEPFAFIRLLQSWDNSGIPWGRDGALHEIDTATYDRISFRMKTSLDQPRTGGRVVWYDCGQLRAECQGGTKFVSEPGWHTYDVPLVNDSGEYPVAWAGMIRGLSLIPSRMGTDVELDWIRLYDSDTGTAVNVTPATAGDVFWDRDTDPTNNTATNPNWGPVATSTGGSVTFNAKAYPPGIYHFYSVDAAGRSSYSSPVKIDARPRVVVIDPDIGGGASYAKKVRRDPWDFKQATDYNITPNASVSVAGGKAVGINTAPDLTDSGMYLTLADGKPINTTKFHRLTMKVFLAGQFDLSANPGGGMNARLAWHRADTGQYLTSDDIVVAPGWNLIQIDLTDFTAAELLEPYAAGFKWKGLLIDQFRIDLHEDAGVRQFKVDYVHLSRDDRASKRKFTVKFRDKAHEAGSTARIFVDNDNQGFDGKLVAEQPVERGKNTAVINRADTGRGKKWVYVEITDPSGTVTRAYSTGPVKM